MLREIRESLMLTKTELAREAGVSYKTIYHIEKGKPCQLATKTKIIQALELKLSDHTLELHKLFSK